MFVLLRNASMLYWDTQNMTASAFSPVGAPGKAESTFLASAHQIRTGSGLPSDVSLTPEERDAILSLNPFTAEGRLKNGRLDKRRFVAVGQVWDLRAGTAIENVATSQLLVAGGTLTRATRERVQASTERDLAFSLAMKAISYGGSAAATAGVAALGTNLGGDFASTADKIGTISIPELFKDESTTTVTTTFSSARLLDKVSDTAITQRFYIKNNGKGISVELYYDKLFGTYVFVPRKPGPMHGRGELGPVDDNAGVKQAR